MLHQDVNIFYLLGVLVLQKVSKILLCVSLEAEPGPCPKAAVLFLDCSFLDPASLSSLISYCLNLPFRTQGKSWKLKLIYGNQKMGDTEKFVWRSPHGPAQFLLYSGFSENRFKS